MFCKTGSTTAVLHDLLDDGLIEAVGVRVPVAVGVPQVRQIKFVVSITFSAIRQKSGQGIHSRVYYTWNNGSQCFSA